MPKSINERIKNRRKELNMSQAELANQVGLKPPAISQYESGARRPSFEALRKLSFALKVSTEYLVSGITKEQTQEPLDHSDRVILRIINSLKEQDKEKLVEYATFLATGRKVKIDTLFETASEYANFYLEEKIDKTLPIDIYGFAKELGIKVFEDHLEEGEGILIQVDHPIIILDRKMTIETRRKFTLAALIGHYVLPWHLKSSYISRKYEIDKDKQKNSSNLLFGHSTLLTEEVEEMEANQFALNILIPPEELITDFIEKNATIESIKELADKKYNVSLFVLLNRLVDFADEKYAVVQSKDSKIIKRFSGKRSLVSFERVDDRSKAASFFTNPSMKEEIREGEVPASSWFSDAKENEMVYEQSVYNPEVGRVLTLLTIVE
ncbi:transcriptional regulator with XRE-family HTH domain/Zn-dependent peptidase ImmA (M78 family) [Bacillus sp. SLBN-46]|uniref:helix-turn-helix domain-containing protein n=1 Tax=Bacillus sp. SLBN-46 TaxID=3042283 RepID=UPI0028625F04|nr:XRE family transcriptional regulator [Bacillus sp. SLBN-46]MDR6123481.1 transcriptional regulator with XRE-family HTH domain/Zn-dependent peptidase ImmA (M78 family) [Bacillus sp. SLBN-46]